MEKLYTVTSFKDAKFDVLSEVILSSISPFFQIKCFVISFGDDFYNQTFFRVTDLYTNAYFYTLSLSLATEFVCKWAVQHTYRFWRNFLKKSFPLYDYTCTLRLLYESRVRK